MPVRLACYRIAVSLILGLCLAAVERQLIQPEEPFPAGDEGRVAVNLTEEPFVQSLRMTAP